MDQIDYRSHPVLRLSDHKPVSAVFDSEVRILPTLKASTSIAAKSKWSLFCRSA